MFNKEEYDTIVSECKKNSKLSSALSDLRKDSLEELSVVSHEIKNYAAYLKTSYQFISHKNSELKDNKFWNNMGTTIDELVGYMNRTSLYRYSFKDSEMIECNVKELLERIKTYIGKKYSNEAHSEKLPLNTELINADEKTSFYISSHLLTLGINELIDNAYEACSNKPICLQIQCSNQLMQLSIINVSDSEPDKSLLKDMIDAADKSGTPDIYSYDLSRLCTPFFTTKKSHSGLGLSSVYQMCILGGASLSMTYNSTSHITTTCITLERS